LERKATPLLPTTISVATSRVQPQVEGRCSACREARRSPAFAGRRQKYSSSAAPPVAIRAIRIWARAPGWPTAAPALSGVSAPPLAAALARLTTIDVKYLIPTILVISLLGAYADRENLWDVALAIGTGVVAYGLTRFDFPIVTLVIGFVMGRLVERAFAQSLQMQLDPFIFFKRPISLLLFCLLVLLFVMPLVRQFIAARRTA